MIFWLHPSGNFFTDCYFAGYMFFVSVGSLCARRKLLVAPYLFLRNKAIKKVLWMFFVVMTVGIVLHLMITRWDVFFSRRYTLLRMSAPLLSNFLYFIAVNIGVFYCSSLMVFRSKNKFLGVLSFIAVSYGLSLFCFDGFIPRFTLMMILTIFFKTTGSTKFTPPRLLFLVAVLLLMPFFVVFSTAYKKFYQVYDRLILDELRISYPLLEFAKKSGWHTYGASSFRHLYTLFAEPKEPHLSLVALNLLSHKPPFAQASRDQIGGSAPSSSPVGLFIDFRLFAFIFAFFCGFLLKLTDNTMIFFTSVRKLDFEVALVYSFLLFSSHNFCHTTFGVVLCSQGLVFFIVLFVHYVNERIFTSTEKQPLKTFR